MAKYFCGITPNKNKYFVSILDQNLNIIFINNIELNCLSELLRRKSVSIISVDAPTTLCLEKANTSGHKYPDKLVLKKRPFDDNVISMKPKYNNHLSMAKNRFESIIQLTRQLNSLGFYPNVSWKTGKSLIETYPDTSFIAMGCNFSKNVSVDTIVKQRVDFLKNKGIHLNTITRKIKENIHEAVNTICQAYVSYLCYTGDVTCFGSHEEGFLVIPVNDSVPLVDSNKNNFVSRHTSSRPFSSHNIANKDNKIKIITEYCGAQYLYTNTDGIIRINDLRPIKSYNPFREIYEPKYIKMVQVIIATTDGLKKVKAFLVPNDETSNSFRAANEDDRKKLENFWGANGDRKGYIIKFNRIDRLDMANE